MTTQETELFTAKRAALLVVASLVLLVPVLVAPVPPITDYPNHLARMWLLSGGIALPSVSHIYEVHIDAYTNLGIDLIALTIGKLTSYEIAGRLSVAAAVLLPSLGGVIFWRSVNGRWHWWMLAFGLLTWGQTVLGAFLNFDIGIGLALLFASLEPALARRSFAWKFGSRMLLSVVLMLTHPFAVLFYAALLAGLIFGRRPAPFTRGYWPQMLRRLLLAALSVAIVGLVFVIATPSLPGAQEHSTFSTIPRDFVFGLQQFSEGVKSKLLNTGFAIRSYDNKLDALTLLMLVVPVGLALAFGRLRVHGGLLILAVGLLVCYLLFPAYLLGAYMVDVRFALMLPFVLVAALAPELPRKPAIACAAALALVLIARAGLVASIWQARQADVAAMAKALAATPAGSSIMPVEMRPLERSIAPRGRYMAGGENSFRHLPALALIWKQDFVPTLFAARGQQPVEVLPPWDQIANPNGGQLADVHVLDPFDLPTGNERLVDGEPVDLVEARVMWHKYASYTDDWKRFDYVLLLNADLPDRFGPFKPPKGLIQVADTGFARLYRVDKEASDAAAASARSQPLDAKNQD